MTTTRHLSTDITESFSPISARILRLLFGSAIIVMLIPAVLTLVSLIYFETSDRVLPGVYALEHDLSWMLPIEVEQLVEAEAVALDPISVKSPDGSWQVSAAQFGFSLDVRMMADQAYRSGREGRGFTRLLSMLTVLKNGQSIEPIVSLDAMHALEHLSTWSEWVSVSPQEDRIEIAGGDIRAYPAMKGQALDILATLDLLLADPGAFFLEQRAVPLVISPVLARQLNTEQAVADLESLLAADVTIDAYDPVIDEHYRWSPAPQEKLDWVDLSLDDSTYAVALVPEQMFAYVIEITSTLGVERTIDGELAMNALLNAIDGSAAEPLIIHYQPREYQVQPGDNLVSIGFKTGMPYWKISEANPSLAQRGLTRGDMLVIPPMDALLTLPVNPDKRIVIGIPQQRMWVYEGGSLKSEHVISTGIPNSPTLPGIFQISSHELSAYASIWDLTMPHFMGIYDAVPGLTNGIHGLPTLSNGRRLWADVLGNPASYGCIILDLQAAEELFLWAEAGVVVEIRAE